MPDSAALGQVCSPPNTFSPHDLDMGDALTAERRQSMHHIEPSVRLCPSHNLSAANYRSESLNARGIEVEHAAARMAMHVGQWLAALEPATGRTRRHSDIIEA